MATSNINVRVDSELKKKAEELFNELGLNLTTAINIFLRKSVNYDGIPFEVKKEIPNETTLLALREYKDMQNEDKYKRYNSFDELLDDVLKSR